MLTYTIAEYCIVIPDRRSLARHRRTHTSFSHINPWSAKNVSHWTHNGNYTDDGNAITYFYCTGNSGILMALEFRLRYWAYQVCSMRLLQQHWKVTGVNNTYCDRNLYLKHPFTNATHIHPNTTTRFTRNHPVIHGRRDAPDPYDPDPSCEMTWHNILLVNSTAWFQPPQNALDSYFAIAQATTNIGQQYTGIGSTSQGQLIQILQSFMNCAFFLKVDLVASNDHADCHLQSSDRYRQRYHREHTIVYQRSSVRPRPSGRI